MTDARYERFKRVFLMNVERRSRTAKGKDEGSKTSSKKLPLLLQGEALKAKVAQNVARLIDDVWNDAGGQRFGQPDRFRSSVLRAMCERWYDIACDGLIDDAGYAPVFAELDAKIAAIGAGDEIGNLNRRYRTWTPGYTVLQIPPALIDEKLGMMLYVPLGIFLKVVATPGGPIEHESLGHILAFADLMMDGEIHPWIDGCSRVSTALCMWIAAIYGQDLPLFAPTKDEHYAPLRHGLEAHAKYFEDCLKRGAAEVP
jgi:hypothetical protein